MILVLCLMIAYAFCLQPRSAGSYEYSRDP